jgi:multicomponent Na+:H+ antiporter subunit G
MIQAILSWLLIVAGTLLWLWGTLPMLISRDFLYRLHTLTVADSLGSGLILAGLFLRRSGERPLLVLALLSLLAWNAVFSYLLATLAPQEDDADGR